ncbi:MAG: DsrE family protein [Gammaproteobacteria bacterium]|nr:DsrE family protein [Gammaproteobacteria bacterium]
MHRYIILIAIAVALAAFIYSDRLGIDEVAERDAAGIDAGGTVTAPDRAVLDITVHTVEELQVLLERAENLVQSPRADDGDASVILVLHGPEVEFFSTRNYGQYKDIVDRAARLDSLDVVDVRICQTMMAARGVARDDIPPFIEQVPDGQVEVDRLVSEGYVYF